MLPPRSCPTWVNRRCNTLLLELGWSATSRRHYDKMMADLGKVSIA
jgi:hypothetical protein